MTKIAKHLEFCAHLAAAVRDGTKTVTYKPLSSNALDRHARGLTAVSDKVPYPVGATARIFEPSGHGAGGLIFESSFTSKDATAPRMLPAGFRPAGLATELTATIVASAIVKLFSITEADARLAVVAPAGSTARAEFERQWRERYRGPQAWEQDPLCWRIEFEVSKG